MSNRPPSEVPIDFPTATHHGSVSGAAPKVLLRRTENGQFSALVSDEERHARWLYCEDLAKQFSNAAQRSKAGKRAHLSEADILAQYLPRLQRSGWVSLHESSWILRRVAAMLNWPLPACLEKIG